MQIMRFLRLYQLGFYYYGLVSVVRVVTPSWGIDVNVYAVVARGLSPGSYEPESF